MALRAPVRQSRSRAVRATTRSIVVVALVVLVLVLVVVIRDGRANDGAGRLHCGADDGAGDIHRRAGPRAGQTGTQGQHEQQNC